MNSKTDNENEHRRRPTIAIVRTDLLRDAKALNVNTSAAAEAENEAAVKKAKGEAWLRENKAAIDAHKQRIDREGTMIKPMWLHD